MGIMRFEAQRTFTGSYRFFKATPVTFAWHFLSIWVPIIGFTLAAENHKVGGCQISQLMHGVDCLHMCFLQTFEVKSSGIFLWPHNYDNRELNIN